MTAAKTPDLSDDASSGSTVVRARRGSSEAWVQIVELYGPLIFGWARRRGLSSDDASDVMQRVLMHVHRAFATYRGDSFRGWLKSICQREIALFYRLEARNVTAPGGSTNQRALAEAASPDDSSHAETAPGDEDLFGGLVQQALELVRSEFSENSMAAFLRTVIEERPASEVASELGISVAAVRQAKYRVLKRMRELLADD